MFRFYVTCTILNLTLCQMAEDNKHNSLDVEIIDPEIAMPESEVKEVKMTTGTGKVRCVFCGVSKEAHDTMVACDTHTSRNLAQRQERLWAEHVSDCVRHRGKKRRNLEFFEEPDRKRSKALSWIKENIEKVIENLKKEREKIKGQIAAAEVEIKDVTKWRDIAKFVSDLNDAKPLAPWRNTSRLDAMDSLAINGASLLTCAKAHLASIERELALTEEHYIEIEKLR